MPPIARIGMNTAIRDMLIEKTVKPISLAPCSVAAIGDMPSSIWREMFSITTIASSTTKPVEMVRAMSDRLSRLKPNRYMTAKVPIKETGTATLGMSVARPLRRKIKTTKTTRTTEIESVRSTSWTEARIVVVRSIATVVTIPAGIEALTEGSSA